MKQIIVISGKGGTGKTVITGAFAALANNKVMADCDVDAANLHLLLDPVSKKSMSLKVAKLLLLTKQNVLSVVNVLSSAVLTPLAKILS
ncbi:MAG: hypothetical protein ABH883_09375 [Candidatus Omnitrophota bacterium]